jgi:hypothetical protein
LSKIQRFRYRKQTPEFSQSAPPKWHYLNVRVTEPKFECIARLDSEALTHVLRNRYLAL